MCPGCGKKILDGSASCPACGTELTGVKKTATLIPYRKDDKWGFCDRDKKITIPVVYDKVDPFSNGYARVHL
ncbi:MAG: WG repeat-containing protein, partial [Candidatus Cryosericum sp.]